VARVSIDRRAVSINTIPSPPMDAESPRRTTLLLDGSTGHELKERLGVLQTEDDSFATAMFANIRHPELVANVHTEYVKAGCDVLTTNTFTATPMALASAAPRTDEDQLPALLHAACRCAASAAATATSGRQVLIAGCLPPLNHCYLPELVPTLEEMVGSYRQIVAELAPRVDLFLAETLCCSAEASAALQAALPSGKPCWLSLTLHDYVELDGSPPPLRGGESIPQLLASLSASKLAPKALLYNWCAHRGLNPRHTQSSHHHVVTAVVAADYFVGVVTPAPCSRP
jgi:S-methylmethionine-dependent homocysteine/selenocysteine methylase